MSVELGFGCLLAVAGFAALQPLRSAVPAPARVWLSIPMGMALFLFVGLGGVVVTGALDPVVSGFVALGIGLAALAGAGLRGGFPWSDLRWLGATVAITALVVVTTRVLHLTRLTPDSLRYLLAADDLVKPDAIAEINRADLLIRQIGLPMLHSISESAGRRYLASVAPLFGVYGLGLFTWFAWQSTAVLDRRRAMWLTVTSTVFLISSNRLLYDVFYINTHIQMAVFLLVAIIGGWLAVSRDQTGWAFPAGMSLGAMVLFRPEAPLVVAIVLVAVAASRANWRVRLLVTVPVSLVTAVWYGLILWQHVRGGDSISLTAPVFGSLVAVFGAVGAVLLGGALRLRPLIRRIDIAAIIGLAAILGYYSLKSPGVLVDSLQATFRNLAYDGLWLLTWGAALVLLVVAFLVQRIDDHRLWTVPILGFALLYWLLPLLREGAWRVGAGDSGNRILAHVLPVVVGFLVLAALDQRRSSSSASDSPGVVAGSR